MAVFSQVKSVHHDIYPIISPTDGLKDAAKGRSVLVTGAGTGIGKATVEAFAHVSAKRVILVGRRLDIVEAVRDETRKKYPDSEIYAESCDVSKAEDVDRIFAICKEHNTEIDVLQFNIKGPYLVTRAFLKQHTLGTPAAVISTSSIGSYNQPPGMSSYGAAKAALNRLTEWAASEKKDGGVQAIALHPSGVGGTEMTSKAPDFLKPMFTETPELAAGTIVYLSTQRVAYLSGRYLNATWDLEELEKLRDRIESEDLLKMALLGAVRLQA